MKKKKLAIKYYADSKDKCYVIEAMELNKFRDIYAYNLNQSIDHFKYTIHDKCNIYLLQICFFHHISFEVINL